MTHSNIEHYAPLVGRVLLVLLFIVSAFGILTNFSGTAGFYASLGIPVAAAAVVVVLLIKILGSLMVATGIHARTGAWALIIFTIAATLMAHIGEGQMVSALKNLSIIGGLLLVTVYGAGPKSLAHLCPCPKCKVATPVAAGGVCNCGSCDACRAAQSAHNDGGSQ
ncbi:DoxX family protein [Candidatus Kaiserbacteria bacterium]|nr:MAG: DoxX family protein [Candidatus Kaiserbacteria bacterium]